MWSHTNAGTAFTAAMVDWARVLASGLDPHVERLGLGHDQVIYWNRPEQAGSGWVMIVDYNSRQVPGRVLYL
jgi:hypothetical protein